MHALAALSALVLSACDTAPDSAAPALPDDALPPGPGFLQITPPEHLVQGYPSVWTVTGDLGNFERVYLAAGPGTGAGPCPAGLGGLCLDLPGARLLGTAQASGGAATFTWTPPAFLPVGTAAHLQGVVIRGLGGVDSFKSAPASAVIEAPVLGCTDTRAQNFAPAANIDDGSCVLSCIGPDAYITNDADAALYRDCDELNVLHVDRSATVTTLDFPNLTTVHGYIYLDQNPALTTFSAPQLTDVVRYLYVTNNAALTTFEAPSITQIGAYAYFANNPGLCADGPPDWNAVVGQYAYFSGNLCNP